MYPFTPGDGRDAVETAPVAFLGEDASTCVGRERVFTHYTWKFGTKQLICRLNYAVEPRYGALVDTRLLVLAALCGDPECYRDQARTFNRDQTIDVRRALAEPGRDDIALYTGNDDGMVVDLFTLFTFDYDCQKVTRRITAACSDAGACGRAVRCCCWRRSSRRKFAALDVRWLERSIAVTDMNAALFDSANGFRGCIPGVLEVLRRGGPVPSIHCLNPHEVLSPGQAEELTRAVRAYSELTDDAFVAANRDKWLS